MSLLSKVKDGFWSHIGSSCAAALVALLAWLFYQIAPVLLPAILGAVAPRVVLSILFLSILLNIVFVFVVWRVTRQQSLKLKFGILWDHAKNPHCPACKNGGLRYGEYNWGEIGYYCNSCKDVFHLADVAGKDISPSVAISQI